MWGVNKGRVSTKSGVSTKGGDVAQGDGDNEEVLVMLGK